MVWRSLRCFGCCETYLETRGTMESGAIRNLRSTFGFEACASIHFEGGRADASGGRTDLGCVRAIAQCLSVQIHNSSSPGPGPGTLSWYVKPPLVTWSGSG